MHPTRELYDFLVGAYDHFNRSLFDARLAASMLTVQRQKGCMGLFYPERWITEKGVRCHELALNPTYFGSFRIVELFQTLVHEQCHMWQEEYGKPSRSGYHNREWADRMESIGLMPSSTGEPGGKRTGQHMSDYPLPGGRFLSAAGELVTDGQRLKWLDRFRVPDGFRGDSPVRALEPGTDASWLLTPLASFVNEEELEPSGPTADARAGKNKIRYTCPACRAKVWGKAGLRLRCDDCNRALESSG